MVEPESNATMKLLKFPKFGRAEKPVEIALQTLVETEENFDLIADPFQRIERSGRFKMDDIELIAETYKKFRTPGSIWDNFRDKHLILPDWFQSDLNPLSDEYFAQQMRLWKAISAVDRAYVPSVDEAEELIGNVDATRYPGFYTWRHDRAIEAASDHVLAVGMLMKHSGLQPGMWALEYGAGFAQAALALARMGVNVDTVDISKAFCGYVKEQADFFRVSLTPFNALFGDNPRGDQKYDLIWFYESFHHCVEFKTVLGKLRNHLTPDGKILLVGEPIGKRENCAVPYPWGLRLESEVVAVIRNLHWFELGFSEDFVVNLFVNYGYEAEFIDCPMSIYGQIYSFAARGPKIELGKHWLPSVDTERWHAQEPAGRWTREASTIALDQTDSFSALDITATNHHAKPHFVHINYGGATTTVKFEPGERKVIRLDAKTKFPSITFASETVVPALQHQVSNDTRALGIYLHSIEYV